MVMGSITELKPLGKYGVVGKEEKEEQKEEDSELRYRMIINKSSVLVTFHTEKILCWYI